MTARSLAMTALFSFAVVAGFVSAAETAALSNLSVRTTMAANQTLIVGGVVSGGAKNILLRAGGPALNKFGLTGMADPRLALYTTGSTPLATNDDWPAALATTFASVGAFAFDSGSKDAALVQSLNGAFTVQATGPGAGAILVEAYDVAGGLSPRMINVSARNQVGTGADALIAGFNISGTGTKTLLIRGVGPGLAAFGVPGTLADPLLKLFDSKGAIITTNDNWDNSLAPLMASVGAFALPANSKDAALVVSLPPGSYSVQVSGADGGTGDGIVEIYEISSTQATSVPLTLEALYGTYRRNPVQNDFHVGTISLKSGSGATAVLQWTNQANVKWNLFPNLSARTLGTDSTNPYFPNPSTFDVLFEVSQVLGFYFGTDFYARDGAPAPQLHLPNQATSLGNVHLGFPRMSPALPSTGNIRIKVIFVDFSDAVATRTPQSVFGILSPGSENFWKGVSYGKLNLTLDPTFTWLRMSKTTSQYYPFSTNAVQKTYIQEAVALAATAGTDFSTCDAVAVMANPDATVLAAGPTWIAGSTANAITIGGKTITQAITSGHDLLTWGNKWLNHEGAHMMGLVDLYPIPGTAQIYVGEYSLMALISGAAPEYFAWERWLLGWFDDDQVVLANPGTTTVALAPLETAGGTKMIVVPLGPTTAVVVENRQPLGFDTALTKPGPLAYLVDTSIGTGSGPIQVLPLDQTDVHKLTATLSVGQTLTYKGISVSCSGSDANTATVVVTRP